MGRSPIQYWVVGWAWIVSFQTKHDISATAGKCIKKEQPFWLLFLLVTSCSSLQWHLYIKQAFSSNLNFYAANKFRVAISFKLSIWLFSKPEHDENSLLILL